MIPEAGSVLPFNTVENSFFKRASVLLDDVIQGSHIPFSAARIQSYSLFKRKEFKLATFAAVLLHISLVLVEDPWALPGYGLPYWITVIPETLFLRGLNGGGIRFSRPLRPLFFVNFPEGRQIRQAFRNIRRTLPEIFRVLVLLMLSIAIFTLMGYKLFCQKNLVKANGSPYFMNYFDTLWDMYVLVTSANNPDVMMPAYDYSRWYAVFFLTYIVLTLYIFMNVVLAVIYNNYKRNLRNEITDFYQRKCELLIEVFLLVSVPDVQETPGPKNQNDGIFDAKNRFLNHDDFIRLLQITFPGESLKYYEALWLILDTNGDRRIDFKEFMQLDDLIHIPYTDLNECLTFLERKLPGLYTSKISDFIKNIVRNMWFRYVFDLIIIVNAFFIAFDLDGAEWYFLVLFTLEIILKVYTFGPKLFVKKLWNLFDLLVVGSALIVSVAQESLNEVQESVISLDVLLALRVLRLFKIFHSIQRFRTVLNTILYIVPSLSTYGGILMIFFYFYALIGMEIFGDRVHSVGYNSSAEDFDPNCGNPLLDSSDFYRNHYCANNFNNVVSSFVLLFELMVVNQWHVLTEGYVLVMQSKWTRLYFLSFNLICVTVILNIYTAFVLEAFIMEYAALHISPSQSQEQDLPLAFSLSKKKINEMGLAFGSNPSSKAKKNEDNLMDADHNDLQFIEKGVDDSGMVSEDFDDYSLKTSIRFSLSTRPPRSGYKLLEKMFCQELKLQRQNPKEPITQHYGQEEGIYDPREEEETPYSFEKESSRGAQKGAAERKAAERERIINERCGSKKDIENVGEMFFLQREVILRDLQINELNMSVSDMKGKFIKPTLKKVSKYENKFAKLQEKAAKFAFANQLKAKDK
ncbi:TPCN3 [Lepeophtheirus salmonis]|uniref:TPCN3 n=1 Tax=Lepeophtheirus salmonis TaxID=72036 RepID=A0A7R8CGY9_LEPSM|nr:TPCN3 [Lepeophtheirus salmonis]CAF2775057.1 TPCN3 [Lepeophtheirus salmonis]